MTTIYCTRCHHKQQKEFLRINHTCLDRYTCDRNCMADADAYYDKYLTRDPTKTANETLKDLTDMIAKENPDLKMLPYSYCDFVAQGSTQTK